jgi:TATA-box binding protein (TBP) (component of TFIID and TFIIIB)
MFSAVVRKKVAASNRHKQDALRHIAEIDAALTRVCQPDSFCISTMNVMVSLSVKRVCLEKVKELFDDSSTKIIADACFKTNVSLQKDHEFNNSVIVKYRIKNDVKPGKNKTRTIAIKLFVNGTLQISGCKCVEDALMNGQLMCRFLESISQTDCGLYTVVDFTVHMVNCNFSFGDGKFVNLAKLHEQIRTRYQLFQRYDANNHAGLIVTLMSQVCPADSVTVMIFSNANIIITGFKFWQELVDAYGVILRIFDDCNNIIMMQDQNARG